MGLSRLAISGGYGRVEEFRLIPYSSQQKWRVQNSASIVET